MTAINTALATAFGDIVDAQVNLIIELLPSFAPLIAVVAGVSIGLLLLRRSKRV